MKAAVFIDVWNLYVNVNNKFKARLDYFKYIDYVSKLYNPVMKFAYGNQDTLQAVNFIKALRLLEFQIKFGPNKPWYVDWTIQCMSIVTKIDAIILGTSDPAYDTLIPWLAGQGIKVHVFSCNIPEHWIENAVCTEIDKTLLESKNESPSSTN